MLKVALFIGQQGAQLETTDDNQIPNSEIVIYEAQDGVTKLSVSFDGDTVWLTQAQIAQLFGTKPQAITKHIQNIYEEDELEESSTCSKMEQVQTEGLRRVRRTLNVYNLDMILSVGYRVNSKQATHFRRWANSVLSEYLIKGFAMDDERLKEGKSEYWRELFERIRDIRSSEKMLYRQVLDLYATAVDYDPHASESIKFFRSSKTSCIMALMVTQLLKSFGIEPMLKSHSWDWSRSRVTKSRSRTSESLRITCRRKNCPV